MAKSETPPATPDPQPQPRKQRVRNKDGSITEFAVVSIKDRLRRQRDARKRG